MKLWLTSSFRDSASIPGYLDTYFRQAGALRDILQTRGDDLGLALVWGDCVDDTGAQLAQRMAQAGLDGYLRELSHGQKDRGHTQNPMRFKALAAVANAMLATVPEDADALLYAESDLLWAPEAALALLADLAIPNVSLAFPMVMIKGLAQFYDIWAYRIREKLFTPWWPYHLDLANGHGPLHELTGAGSFAVVSKAALPALRRNGFPEWDVWPGLVRALAADGYKSFLDTRVEVFHPWKLY